MKSVLVKALFVAVTGLLSISAATAGTALTGNAGVAAGSMVSSGHDQGPWPKPTDQIDD